MRIGVMTMKQRVRRFYLLMLVVSVIPLLFCTKEALSDEISGEDRLLAKVKEGEVSAHEDLDKKLSSKSDESGVQNDTVALNDVKAKSKKSTTNNTDIDGLLEEIGRLKNKVTVTKAVSLSTESPVSRKKIGSKVIYSYEEGKIYEVHAAVDRVTVLELAQGEHLTSTPIAGDTVRWKLSTSKKGSGEGEQTFIVIKPTEESIETNFFIVTDKHTYNLKAISSDFFVPSIAWNYPEDEARAQAELETAKEKASERTEKVMGGPEDLRFAYEVVGRDSYAWKPVRVFDDGKKTFIQMPSSAASAEAPVLFLLDDESEPSLVNYRVKGDYYIVDRLITRAELRVGQDRSVKIFREGYGPSFWDKVF